LEVLAIKVLPRSATDKVVGRVSSEPVEVQVKTTAPPDGGKANAAVIKLLARELGLPKSAIQIKRGQTARHKLLAIDTTPGQLQSWLDGLPVLPA
jgi:uncharacterized protein (TIGR00251 family)